MDQQTEKNDAYTVSVADKRILVLLNVHSYKDPCRKILLPYRDTKQDTSSMKDAFRHRGFNVDDYCRTDFVTKEMAIATIQSALDSIDEDPASHSCFALSIMTHGKWAVTVNSTATANQNEIKELFYFSDCLNLSMDEVAAMVTRCKGLKGKPKLFFIQACRGYSMFGSDKLTEDEQGNVVKSERDKDEKSLKGGDSHRAVLHPEMPARVPISPDCMVSWATSPDYVAFKSQDGAPYITYLCKVLKSPGFDELDLLTMITIVHECVAEKYATSNTANPLYHGRKQMPWLASMLRKKVFLPVQPTTIAAN